MLLDMSDDEIIIYKTTNLITGKIYVGKHTTGKKNYLGSGKWLKRSVKKYGRHNFKREVLETCTSLEELDIREIYWIAQLDARNPKIGYNLNKGGLGNSSEDVSGRKNPMYNKKHKESSKKLMSLKRIGKSNIIKGKTWDEVYGFEKANKIRKKCSKKRIGVSLNLSPEALVLKKIQGEILGKRIRTLKEREFLSKLKTKYQVEQIDILTGNIIYVWPSANEIAKQLKISSRAIRRCCIGKAHTTYNYKWRYKIID
jgi:group I intron endonuclease